MGTDILPRELRRILVASALVHVVVIAAMVTSPLWARSKQRPDFQNVLVTKLVRLGKERDKKLLPRLQSEAPAAKPAVAIGPKDAAAKPPVQTKSAAPALSASERLAQMSQVSDALDRLRQNGDEPEGSPGGVAEGEVTDLTMAIMGNKYLTEIYRCMKSNFAVEGAPPQAVAGKKASVLVRAGADGTLFEPQLVSPSGMELVDRAVLLAVKRCGKVSPPPPALRETVNKDGILIDFIP